MRAKKHELVPEIDAASRSALHLPGLFEAPRCKAGRTPADLYLSHVSVPMYAEAKVIRPVGKPFDFGPADLRSGRTVNGQKHGVASVSDVQIAMRDWQGAFQDSSWTKRNPRMAGSLTTVNDWSGRQDSNLRPLRPERSALPD